MNILKKIGYSLIIMIAALLIQGLLAQTDGTERAGIRLIPGAILILGLLYIWTRKSKVK